MIALNELDQVLATARALTHVRQSFGTTHDLREALVTAIRMLVDEIEADTPAKKEARRNLRIETVALLHEIEMAARVPTEANRTCVDHRLAAWGELLQQVRQTLGLTKHGARS